MRTIVVSMLVLAVSLAGCSDDETDVPDDNESIPIPDENSGAANDTNNKTFGTLVVPPRYWYNGSNEFDFSTAPGSRSGNACFSVQSENGESYILHELHLNADWDASPTAVEELQWLWSISGQSDSNQSGYGSSPLEWITGPLPEATEPSTFTGPSGQEESGPVTSICLRIPEDATVTRQAGTYTYAISASHELQTPVFG
jgi:hypothetical protein